MGKVKIKKQDVWIDMTPMSDVMVLLLTFFMMALVISSTFTDDVMTFVMSFFALSVPMYSLREPSSALGSGRLFSVAYLL